VPGARTIVIVPKSNSTVRDWPVVNYATLARLLLDQLDCRIFVIGSPVQADAADAIVAANPGGRVVSLVGKTKWSDLPAILRAADIVICNNSGVAHQSASLGTRTLGIYSASHQPQEWGPRGVHSKALMAPVPCSPCGYEQVEQCPNDHACMTLITPDIVLGHALRMLEAAGERVAASVFPGSR
jgi:ADP-heptose:LPS heptosyltransferase